MSYPESYKGDWVITLENGGAIAFSGTYLEVREFLINLSFQAKRNQKFSLWSVGFNQCNFVDFLRVNVL